MVIVGASLCNKLNYSIGKQAINVQLVRSFSFNYRWFSLQVHFFLSFHMYTIWKCFNPLLVFFEAFAEFSLFWSGNICVYILLLPKLSFAHQRHCRSSRIKLWRLSFLLWRGWRRGRNKLLLHTQKQSMDTSKKNIWWQIFWKVLYCFNINISLYLLRNLTLKSYFTWLLFLMLIFDQIVKFLVWNNGWKLFPIFIL